jgi:HK97 family phage major capsid protein
MAKRLIELRQKIEDSKAKGKTLLEALEAAENNNAEDLGAHQEAFDAWQKDHDELTEALAAEERSQERRRSLGGATSLSGIQPARRVTSDEPDPETTHGFRSMAEYAIAVQRACNPAASVVDPRLLAAPTSYHEAGGANGEAYLMPSAMRATIWDAVAEQESLLNEVDLEPTQARQVSMLADETTPWGSSGVQAFWRAEGTQMNASKLDTQGRTVQAHELYAFVLATEELLEDAPRLESRIRTKAPQAIAWKASDAVVYGTGAGQPLGWFNSSAMVTIAKEAAQAADSIVAENILKMYAAHLVVPGDTPYWLANRDILPKLGTLTIGDQPMWTPPNGLMGAPGGFLLGIPIKWSEHAKTLGDKGDLTLVSPKGYYAARRTVGATPDYAESIHLFFDYNIKAFRFIFRIGGQPHLSAPITPPNSPQAKSHFVTLAERA